MVKKQKLLITLTGPVGSGKTHIARILSKKLGAAHIRTDNIRVKLRRRGRSFAGAPKVAQQLAADALRYEKSVIIDSDILLQKRRRKLKKMAENMEARFILVKVNTPEKLILKRLRKKKYTAGELFKNAKEAIRVYFIRKKLSEKLRRESLKIRPDFVINNARPLKPQIEKIISM